MEADTVSIPGDVSVTVHNIARTTIDVQGTVDGDWSYVVVKDTTHQSGEDKINSKSKISSFYRKILLIKQILFQKSVILSS